MKHNGFFITLEGPEGCGKTSHISALAGTLRLRGYRVYVTREPGGTALGKTIRNILLATRTRLHPHAELLLFLADRIQHVHEVISPHLTKGTVVLSDRFMDSTFAYQVGGRKLPSQLVQALNAWASFQLVPNLTILLDVPVRTGLIRARQKSQERSKTIDRFESAKLRFHEEVRRAYQALAKKFPKRFITFQTEQPFAVIQQEIQEVVLRRLKKWKA